MSYKYFYSFSLCVFSTFFTLRTSYSLLLSFVVILRNEIFFLKKVNSNYCSRNIPFLLTAIFWPPTLILFLVTIKKKNCFAMLSRNFLRSTLVRCLMLVEGQLLVFCCNLLMLDRKKEKNKLILQSDLLYMDGIYIE